MCFLISAKTKDLYYKSWGHVIALQLRAQMGILVLVGLAYIAGLTGKSRESYMHGGTSMVMSVVISQGAEHNLIACGHVYLLELKGTRCYVFGSRVRVSNIFI